PTVATGRQPPSKGKTMATVTDDGPRVQLLVLHMALKLQAEHGIHACRFSAPKCARSLGFIGRTAKQLLADVEAKHPWLKR
ncbi:MAG: hypothetical protein ACO3CL_08520, partial [Bacteroidia bacterium]